jgi:N-acetylmuramic acid 6-phosphate etherase
VGSKLYAGIDAGGTLTRCVVADETGAILGVGRGGPGNALVFGLEGALAAYRAAVRGATEGLSQPLTHLHIGAAGTKVPDEAAELAGTLSSGNDGPAAFAGALVEGPGLIVIAGTGSAVYGEAPGGRSVLIGGWGPLAGDEGSGYAIGREALRALTLVLDGRASSSPLADALMSHLGVSARPAMQTLMYHPPMPREEIAALTSIVAAGAAGGDEQAKSILAAAACDLAATVAAGAKLLDLHGASARVSTLGGVWSAGPLVLQPFADHLGELVPGATVQPARYPPVIGALLLAYRQSGVPVSPSVLEQLSHGLNKWGLQ